MNVAVNEYLNPLVEFGSRFLPFAWMIITHYVFDISAIVIKKYVAYLGATFIHAGMQPEL